MSSRKAQFFLIASVVVVSFLAAIQTQLSTYSEADTAAPARMIEAHYFNAAKEQLNRAYRKNPCVTVGPFSLTPELIEIANLTETEAAKRGTLLDITFTDPCPGSVGGRISIKSDVAELRETFSLG